MFLIKVPGANLQFNKIRFKRVWKKGMSTVRSMNGKEAEVRSIHHLNFATVIGNCIFSVFPVFGRLSVVPVDSELL